MLLALHAPKGWPHHFEASFVGWASLMPCHTSCSPLIVVAFSTYAGASALLTLASSRKGPRRCLALVVEVRHRRLVGDGAGYFRVVRACAHYSSPLGPKHVACLGELGCAAACDMNARASGGDDQALDQPVREADYLKLFDLAGRQVLCHTGTAEWKVLDGAWDLVRDAEGNGILAPSMAAMGETPQRTPQWASDLLKLRVEQHAVGHEAGLAVLHGDNFVGWVDELRRTDRFARVFESRRSSIDKYFACECVVCRYPPTGTDAHIWWNLSYPLFELLGKPKYDSWVSRKSDRFEQVVKECGLDGASSIRRSWRSLAGKERMAAKKGVPSPASSNDEGGNSLLVSSAAILAICGGIAVRPKQWRADDQNVAANKALWIIDSIASEVGNMDWPQCCIQEQPKVSFSIGKDCGALSSMNTPLPPYANTVRERPGAAPNSHPEMHHAFIV